MSPRLRRSPGDADRSGRPRHGDDHGANRHGADVRIVLAVPARARVAGATVASQMLAGPARQGGARHVAVIALWENGTSGVASDAAAPDTDGTGPLSGSDPGPGAPSETDCGEHPSSVPWATPRARRAAEHVRSAGVEVLATGNTVRATLPADEVQAVAAIERLTASPDRAPVVCVVARPWGAGWLRLIERAGAVHVAGPAPSVDASRAMLLRHHVRVVEAPRPTGVVAMLLLRAGWAARALIRASTDGTAGRNERGSRHRPRSESEIHTRGQRIDDDSGQALLVVLLGVAVAIVVAGVLGAVAMAMSGRQDQQRAVDVAALAAAAQLRAGASGDDGSIGAGPRLTARAVRSRAVAVARAAARENDVAAVDVDFPADSERAPVAAPGTEPDRPAGTGDGPRGSLPNVVPQRVRVRAVHRPAVAGVVLAGDVAAIAEVATPSYTEAVATGDEYSGPFAIRQGKPMRPDVALGFDRMNAAATAAGHPLTVTSGYRSNAEQARLFAAHPDPKWVARPGTSLHRLGTELDLGPPSAYGWLAANSRRFGFLKRYSWEPWHFGFTRETASAHVAEQGRNPAAPQTRGTIPSWVPTTYRDLIRAASIRFKVSAALLSAQLKAESNFDARAVSSAGAQGIAQFMPGTAAGVGLGNPFDPAQAIPAQAQLMARLLRRFGSVPLALAAYNAGEGRVGACHCIPPYPETQHYVARIIALMRGYDDAVDGSGLTVRLVG
jgi:soluble lytic murein transglycosylase-like protein